MKWLTCEDLHINENWLSLRNNQLIITPQLGIGSCETHLLHAVRLIDLTFCRSSASNNSCYEFMSSIACLSCSMHSFAQVFYKLFLLYHDGSQALPALCWWWWWWYRYPICRWAQHWHVFSLLWPVVSLNIVDYTLKLLWCEVGIGSGV